MRDGSAVARMPLTPLVSTETEIESDDTAAPRAAAGGVALGRVLGQKLDEPTGKWLVVVAGIHGNEPAGVEAVQRVFRALEASGEALAGAFVAFAGNLGALAAKQRYLDRDLNRAWRDVNLARVWAGGRQSREDQELAELEHELSSALAGAHGRVFVLDLHTTSGDGPPFAVLDDSLPNRRFALAFPVPLVLGLEEELAGTMVFHWTAHGYISLAFEGGQHDDPRSVDRSEAAVWIALDAAGLLPKSLRGKAEVARELLRASRGEAPQLVEVLYRHRIEASDRFRMKPGYRSFEPVEEGQELAVDQKGAVRSPKTARLLMPLYQPQGDDGFFLAVPVPRFWFELSATLRRLRADRLLRWLPGVRPYADRPDTFLVSRRIARAFVPELFHLLGYKRLDHGARHYVFTRRAEGL
jgi:succinylglutamate desuccinylase